MPMYGLDAMKENGSQRWFYSESIVQQLVFAGHLLVLHSKNVKFLFVNLCYILVENKFAVGSGSR